MITVSHLKKTYIRKHNTHSRGLVDVSFTLPEKGFVFVLGKSGSGKSTLLNLLGGLDTLTDGKIYLGNKDFSSFTEKEKREYKASFCGFIFQDYKLIDELTVKENIALSLELISDEEEKEKRIDEILKEVDLVGYENRYPKELSGGQKQRVAIARALACDPKILLCDEATSALDPQTTESILSLLKEINKNTGITIVIITHQMSVVETICNKVAIIDNGDLVETGYVADVFANPKSTAAKKLIFGGAEDEMLSVKHVDKIPEKGKTVRIVFSENSSFEPVVADLILQFNVPVNILYANTRDVGGIAKGDMVITLPEDRHLQIDMIEFLKKKGLDVQEVS